MSTASDSSATVWSTSTLNSPDATFATPAASAVTTNAIQAKAQKPRGTNRTPAQSRYRGKNPRALRKLQQTLFLIKRRELTKEEKGATRSLSSPWVDDRPRRNGSAGNGRGYGSGR